MIKKLTFRSGPSQEKSPLELDTTPITIFVGPNNSGKSQVLREIEQMAKGDDTAKRILQKVSFSSLTPEEILAEIPAFLHPAPDGNRSSNHIILPTTQDRNLQIRFPHVYEMAADPEKHTGINDFSALRDYSMLNLNGQNRFSTINDSPVEGINYRYKTLIGKLFWDDELRKKLRDILYSVFNKYILINYMDMQAFRLTFSDSEPESIAEEKGLFGQSINFHNKASSIHGFSDGVKAFAGIMLAIIASNPKILLLDEPEAFLHPGLATKLGKEVSLAMNGPQKRLFVATHSAAFLMGCIQSRTAVNIVRLTYNKGIATTRVLPADKLLHLMRNPMLRSTGVLEGLFFEAVVVTEADSDRAFYQEINERLKSANDSRAIVNCLFLNAQNKQTVWDIIKPLRELGIPAIGIVDLDMVRDGGSEFVKVIENNFIPGGQQQALSAYRISVRDSLDTAASPFIVPSGEAKKDTDFKRNYWKRNGGIRLLPKADKEVASNFFDELEKYGVFVVRGGELEDWLQHLHVPKGNKKEWLPTMFVKMGEDPANVDYVNPSGDDVWEFIGRISRWVNNSSRLGIPEQA